MKKILILALMFSGFFVSLSAQELTTFAGYHTQLHGYTDPRYLGDDKGDYLKTLAGYSGVEFVQKGPSNPQDPTQNVVFGAAGVFFVKNGFNQVTLYAVPSKGILAQTVPPPSNQTAEFEFIASGFGGYETEWWSAEGGLSFFISGQNETYRLMFNSAGEKVEVAGRGWVFLDKRTILPNLLFRIGSKVYPHFVLSLYRGHYDPGYGALQARVQVPFNRAFVLQVGGSLYQTNSVFVEPIFTWGEAQLSLRMGTILNYNNSAFTKVGILEGAFMSAALGLHW